jgi:hypothetical protein
LLSDKLTGSFFGKLQTANKTCKWQTSQIFGQEQVEKYSGCQTIWGQKIAAIAQNWRNLCL